MKTNLSTFSVKSLDTVSGNIVHLTEQNAQEEAKTHVLFTTLKTEWNAYSPLVLKETTSGMAEKVRIAFLTTYKHYKRVKLILEGHAEFPETPKGTASVALLAIIKKAGSIYRENIPEANSSMNNLVAELEKPENTEHIAAAGVTDEVTQLKESKELHSELFTSRIDAESALSQIESASVARDKLEKALRNYLKFINAMREVTGWQDLYSDLNEAMKAANRSLREGNEVEPVK